MFLSNKKFDVVFVVTYTVLLIVLIIDFLLPNVEFYFDKKIFIKSHSWGWKT